MRKGIARPALGSTTTSGSSTGRSTSTRSSYSNSGSNSGSVTDSHSYSYSNDLLLRRSCGATSSSSSSSSNTISHAVVVVLSHHRWRRTGAVVFVVVVVLCGVLALNNAHRSSRFIRSTITITTETETATATSVLAAATTTTKEASHTIQEDNTNANANADANANSSSSNQYEYENYFEYHYQHQHKSSSSLPSSSSSSSSQTDPSSLKRGVQSFLASRHPENHNNKFNLADHLWDLLENYPLSQQQHVQQHVQQQQQQQHETEHRYYHYYYEHDVLSPELVCGTGPGRGMEQDAGYKLLAEKIRMVDDKDDSTIHGSNDNDNSNSNDDSNSNSNDNKAIKEPRLLCMVYTYSPMRYLVRSQALIWGKDCDGFLAVSNETLPSLGIYQLPPVVVVEEQQQQQQQQQQQNPHLHLHLHPPPIEEDYQHMWQKVRRMWKHVHDHFLRDYDYFYISGDDVYLLVENLRAFLREVSALDHDHDDDNNHNRGNGNSNSNTNTTTPRHFGSWLPVKSTVAGGPGYVLNRAALERFVGRSNDKDNDSNDKDKDNDDTSKNNNNNNNNNSSVWSRCLATVDKPYEDRFLSRCLSEFLGIRGNDTDTRDPITGEQRFHDDAPASLYLTRAARSLQDRRSSYGARMAKSWQDQTLPEKTKTAYRKSSNKNDNDNKNKNGSGNSTTTTTTTTSSSSPVGVVGPKHEPEAAAAYSISLHRIGSPTYMARIHAILRPTRACPIDSPLGKGLRQHFVPRRESNPNTTNNNDDGDGDSDSDGNH